MQAPVNAVKSAVTPVIQAKVQETVAIAESISSVASRFSQLANSTGSSLTSSPPVTNPTDQSLTNLPPQQVVPLPTTTTPAVPVYHGHTENLLITGSSTPLPLITSTEVNLSPTLGVANVPASLASPNINKVSTVDEPNRQIIPSGISSLPSNVASQVQSQISGLQSQVSSVGGNVVTQVQDQMSSVQSQVASIPSTIGGMLPTGILPSISNKDSTCH